MSEVRSKALPFTRAEWYTLLGKEFCDMLWQEAMTAGDKEKATMSVNASPAAAADAALRRNRSDLCYQCKEGNHAKCTVTRKAGHGMRPPCLCRRCAQTRKQEVVAA